MLCGADHARRQGLDNSGFDAHGECIEEVILLTLVCVAKGTLPCLDDFPAHDLQLSFHPCIASSVTQNLRLPELRSCLGQTVQRAIVTMPEASMDKDDGPVFRQHDIRSPRQSSSAQAVAESPRMEALAYKDLQFGVRATDPRHLCGSLRRGKTVNQVQALAFFFAGFAGSEADACRRWGTMIRATSLITGTTTELPNCL